MYNAVSVVVFHFSWSWQGRREPSLGLRPGMCLTRIGVFFWLESNGRVVNTWVLVGPEEARGLYCEDVMPLPNAIDPCVPAGRCSNDVGVRTLGAKLASSTGDP